ncbi:ricin-type beta-trefoil lectin domain protein [Streptomyces sp. NPDC058953]|uniref:ricin-type beta-trefoil lectin domain protein n=1 Tax=Streptomyces sp. NPDC058953 TaxID=3346676 RepID=UPI0036D0B7D7
MTYGKRTTARRLRAGIAAVAAVAAGLVGLSAPSAGADQGRTGERAPAAGPTGPRTPPRAALRPAGARQRYGSHHEPPRRHPQTGLISLGDSEISGEGVGTPYEAGTDGPSNWCHRSRDAAIHRTGIPADVTYNVACSGAFTGNIRIGGQRQYADELVQSDNLAIKARNTRIKMVLLVAGANDDLQFGPVMTDCVVRYVTLQGPCAPKYGPGWQARVDGLVPKVEATVRDLRTVMRDAGYAEGDYKLVVMGYPGPIGPDFRDNPKFPGKLICGGMGYDADTVWARNTAVPAFEKGMREAARSTGAIYLDNSRLFHGHEVCMEDTWARGLHLELGNPVPPDENTARQSFHPNARGHAAFATCLTQMYGSNLREGSCAESNSDGRPVLRDLAWDDAYKPLRNQATGECVDVEASTTRNGTKVFGWECHGERNQGWWQDPAAGSVHTELTQDRCLDVPGADYRTGAELIVWNCSGAANQRFTPADGTLRPAAAPSLCATQEASRAPLRLRPCTGAANQRFA